MKFKTVIYESGVVHFWVKSPMSSYNLVLGESAYFLLNALWNMDWHEAVRQEHTTGDWNNYFHVTIKSYVFNNSSLQG
jgi:hypothetical protein